jgi:hypothetical protein
MSTENEPKSAATETPKTPQWKRKTQNDIAMEMGRHGSNGVLLQCASDVEDMMHTLYGTHDDGYEVWGVSELFQEVGKRLRDLESKVNELEIRASRASQLAVTEPEPTKEPTT